ncbi:MAG: hypothetical protein CMJ90_16785 [Planctomycetes bacterium]|nr:hypothetical protein [Planctomycetota bacterium]
MVTETGVREKQTVQRQEVRRDKSDCFHTPRMIVALILNNKDNFEKMTRSLNDTVLPQFHDPVSRVLTCFFVSFILMSTDFVPSLPPLSLDCRIILTPKLRSILVK